MKWEKTVSIGLPGSHHEKTEKSKEIFFIGWSPVDIPCLRFHHSALGAFYSFPYCTAKNGPHTDRNFQRSRRYISERGSPCDAVQLERRRFRGIDRPLRRRRRSRFRILRLFFLQFRFRRRMKRAGPRPGRRPWIHGRLAPRALRNAEPLVRVVPVSNVAAWVRSGGSARAFSRHEVSRQVPVNQ